MRLIRTEEAHPGQKTARDVTDLRGNLLFRAGTELTPELLARLQQRHVTHLFVEEDGPPPAPSLPERKTPEQIAAEGDRMFAGRDGSPAMAALREAAKRYLIAQAQ